MHGNVTVASVDMVTDAVTDELKLMLEMRRNTPPPNEWERKFARERCCPRRNARA